MDDDRIILNVGGQNFITTRATLLRDPNSGLAAMIRPEIESGKREFFFDRDPKNFGHILNFLRDGPKNFLPPNEKNLLENLRQEAKNFGLVGLEMMIENNLNRLENPLGAAGIHLGQEVEICLKSEELPPNFVTSWPFFVLQEWDRDREKREGDARAPKFINCQKCGWLLGVQAPVKATKQSLIQNLLEKKIGFQVVQICKPTCVTLRFFSENRSKNLNLHVPINFLNLPRNPTNEGQISGPGNSANSRPPYPNSYPNSNQNSNPKETNGKFHDSNTEGHVAGPSNPANPRAPYPSLYPDATNGQFHDPPPPYQSAFGHEFNMETGVLPYQNGDQHNQMDADCRCEK